MTEGELHNQLIDKMNRGEPLYPPLGQMWPDRPPKEGERMTGFGRLLYPIGTIVNRPEGRLVVGPDFVLRAPAPKPSPAIHLELGIETRDHPETIRVEIRSPWPRHCAIVAARILEPERDGHGHQVEIVRVLKGDTRIYWRGTRLDHVVRTFGAWGCGPRWHMNQCNPKECTCRPAGEIA